MAVDDLHAQVTRRRGGSLPVTEWELTGREERRNRNSLEVALSGRNGPGISRIDEGRLVGRMRRLALAVGDLNLLPLRAVTPLMRVRGVSLDRLRDDVPWSAMAGVAAPSPGAPAAQVALAHAEVDAVPLGGAQAAAALFAFGRGARSASAATGSVPAVLPGGGGGTTFELHSKPGSSFVALALGGQMHDLDGAQALSGLERLEWRLSRPTVALSLYELQTTTGWRSLASDRLAAGACRDDRLAAQWRLLRGRAETHVAAAASGGQAMLDPARSAQLGGSMNLGRSAWFAGGDAQWRTGNGGALEQRLTLQSGGFARAGSALLQIERVSGSVVGRPGLFLNGQASMALRAGLRALLEPRVAWRSGRMQNADLELGLNWAPAQSLLRLTTSLTLSLPRDAGSTARVREMAVSLQFAPHLRDRSLIEVRRFDEAGGLEVTSGYDLQDRRFGTSDRDLRRDRWVGCVRVTVVRSADGAGIPDALVSLDGQRFAFTAEDGTAEFHDVEPGTHLVGLEERSLGFGQRATQTTRIFVAVERGKPVAPVRIEVARAERRAEF